MPNLLAGELSPYLLQHAGNPVHWRPWNDEARDLALREEKPIFLSIGYSSCHWCHVMAHDSFEDPGIAAALNADFVSVKVDREERPELDQVCMEAVQAMTGQGGWPLSIFLTPSLEPFFGGTFWPARSRGGMPGFDEILRAVSSAWRGRREEVLAQAARLTRFLRESRLDGDGSDGAVELDDALVAAAVTSLARSFDARHGGFGGAPKFPQPIALGLLLRRWRKTRREELLGMATTTLDRMAAGGIRDHLGGGFHRYSVDARWLVPHFEKMLYDNALLAGCYAEARQATGNEDYGRVAAETLDYVLRDMTSPDGAFFSSEDADSEGEEGRFYLWTPEEVDGVLGRDAARTFCAVYDISAPGNFEGRNILHLSTPPETCARMLDRPVEELNRELARSREALRAARENRVRPARDDKVLASWNALMIDAMAVAGRLLDRPRYVDAAARAADFALRALRDDDGRLLHCRRGEKIGPAGYLDDYAGTVVALLSLFEARPEPRWLEEAVRLADAMRSRFGDPAGGGLFYAAEDHEPLIARKKDFFDGSTPSGNGLAAAALVRLGRVAGREDFRDAAERILRAAAGLIRQAPTATGQLLLALDEMLDGRAETTSATETL